MVAGSAQIRECDALRSARGLHASLSDLATSSSCNCRQVRVRCCMHSPQPSLSPHHPSALLRTRAPSRLFFAALSETRNLVPRNAESLGRLL